MPSMHLLSHPAQRPLLCFQMQVVIGLALSDPMIGENQQLVTNEQVEFEK